MPEYISNPIYEKQTVEAIRFLLANKPAWVESKLKDAGVEPGIAKTLSAYYGARGDPANQLADYLDRTQQERSARRDARLKTFRMKLPTDGFQFDPADWSVGPPR